MLILEPNQTKEELFIIKKMTEGDRDAFRYFFDKYYKDLCNFVLLYLKEQSLAEEVVQDIFVYFWENRSKLKINDSVRGYLFGASKFKSLNVIREMKNHSKAIERLSISNIEAQQMENTSFAEIDEFKNILSSAIGMLPEKCRMIFILSKQSNLSNREIADKLNISVKTVENQMTIALKKLREALSPHRDKLFIFFLIDFFSR